jgi:uncharacterized protein YggE
MKTFKKSAFALVGILGIGSALLLATSANAATSPTRYISLSSSGTVKVTPDAVKLNMTVSVLLPASKDALASASVSASAVRSALTALGIAAKYLKTTSITVYPEYNYTPDAGSVLKGYRASQSFDVTIVVPKNAGAIVDAVVAAGGDNLQINGVSPFVLKNDAATDSARAVAVKNARSKAASYAKLLGVKLGSVIYMEETGTPNPYPIFSITAKADSGATVVDLGQQDVTVSISIRFYIS